MIEAKLIHNEDGVKLEMTGHAGTAPKGQDLVCAAATALACTAAQAARFLYEQGRLAQEPEIRLEEGEAVVTAVPNEDAECEILMMFWTVQAGLFVLQHNYPDRLKLQPMAMEAA